MEGKEGPSTDCVRIFILIIRHWGIGKCSCGPGPANKNVERLSMLIILFRLIAAMLPGTILLPIGLFISGWTARADIHWIATDIVSSHSLSPTLLGFTLAFDHLSSGYRVGRRRHDPKLPINTNLRD